MASVNASWAEQQRQLGAIRFYLERVPQTSQDISGIEQRVFEQRQKVRQLEELLSNFDTDDRLQSALNAIPQIITALGKRPNS